MKKTRSIGGGIWCLIPALVLAEIETRTGRAVADCFDMIANAYNGNVENLKTEAGKFRPIGRRWEQGVCF